MCLNLKSLAIYLEKKMKRVTSTAMICIGVLFLTGCNTEMTADVYSADLFSDENIRTPAVMKLEITSCTSEKRSDYEQKALALFDTGSEAKITGCNSEAMDSMLEIGFQAEIASENSTADLALFRELWEDEENIARAIKPVFSPDFMQRVNTMLQQNYQKLKYDDLTVSIIINNDLREDVMISASNVWVDGTPHEFYRKEHLKRRERVVITLPNVTSDLIIRNKQPVAAWVSMLKEK